MAIKSVNFTILNNGLGAVSPGGGETIVVVGVSSSGTAATLLESTNPGDFVTSYGYGPAVEAAGFIANTSGNPVVFVKAATVVAGTSSAVTHTGTGTSVVTLTGAPYDTYYAAVTVTSGGTIGVTGCVLTVSLDAGRTTFATVNLGTALTYLIPNTNVTLNFAAGTLVAGDVYTFISTEPKWNGASLTLAIGALISSSNLFKNILVVGDVDASEAATIDAEMTVLFNQKRFSRAFTNARDVVDGGTAGETSAQWVTAIEADFAAFDSERISSAAGFYNVISPFTQTQYRRPLSWVAAAVDAQATIGQDISAVSLGSIPALPRPTVVDGFVYFDSQVNPSLNNARFLTAQQIFGLSGYYIANSNMMSQLGTDFSILPYCEVVDVACKTSYSFFVQQLGGSVRVNSTTGFILAADANDLDGRCTSALETSLGAGVSSVYCLVNRTTNILSTQTLYATIGIVPLGYINVINVTMTLVNPAIAAV